MIEFKDVPNSRRTRVLKITGPAVLEALKGCTDARIVANALPEDTRILQVGHDWDGTLYFIITSETFDEVQNCGRLPEHPPILFEKIR